MCLFFYRNLNYAGANLKGALFDNSQMNGVNLRLASLKGACLRSCNLRYSVMAGTDLEVLCTCTLHMYNDTNVIVIDIHVCNN